MSELVPADGRPPRLIRFRGPFADRDMVASLDRETNILSIWKELYDTLDAMSQHRIDKTSESFLYVSRAALDNLHEQVA